MSKIEVWKDIPEYEGLYKASTLGRVREKNKTSLTTYLMVIRLLSSNFKLTS
ncbi:hypothetical protein LC76P1_00060 [Lysinibacillus phage LC76P1]|nr:hypothetical protein LC76P1_00060 [Lysinibacillus phage LC76P1]